LSVAEIDAPPCRIVGHVGVDHPAANCDARSRVRAERDLRDAVERYFETHRPWSLFILSFHALLVGWPPSRGYALFLVPLAIVPIGLTMLSLMRMCREVLGMTARGATLAVAVHQAMTYVMVGIYAGWASAYLPRLVGLIS
jgi:hypothetical protein